MIINLICVAVLVYTAVYNVLGVQLCTCNAPIQYSVKIQRTIANDIIVISVTIMHCPGLFKY